MKLVIYTMTREEIEIIKNSMMIVLEEIFILKSFEPKKWLTNVDSVTGFTVVGMGKRKIYRTDFFFKNL